MKQQNDGQETTGFICVCKECDFTDSFDAVSAEHAMIHEEDPAQEHYLKTDHACVSVPAAQLDAEKIREMVFK